MLFSYSGEYQTVRMNNIVFGAGCCYVNSICTVFQFL